MSLRRFRFRHCLSNVRTYSRNVGKAGNHRDARRTVKSANAELAHPLGATTVEPAERETVLTPPHDHDLTGSWNSSNGQIMLQSNDLARTFINYTTARRSFVINLSQQASMPTAMLAGNRTGGCITDWHDTNSPFRANAFSEC